MAERLAQAVLALAADPKELQAALEDTAKRLAGLTENFKETGTKLDAVALGMSAAGKEASSSAQMIKGMSEIGRAEMQRLADEAKKPARSLSEIGAAIKTVGDDSKKLGQALLPLSAAIVGLGGASIKVAIDFESSFAGVRKTVGDATDSLGNLTSVGLRLQTGMRDLAKEIPVNVNELNKIGEAAGQLGIKSDNILSFTRVMADLGVTTNLSSDQAATALARLANITQMPQTDFDRLGSTIVALGNNMATTEAEITEFGLRIAGAGKQVGLSEAQILAIGAALSSVGIEAEAGGSSISKVMIDMASSVAAGGDRLTEFASVAGMTAAQFKQQFQTDAAGALTAFIAGLGNMEAKGQSTLGVLNEMGITEIRMRDALLRSAGAGDLLARSLQIGTEAWSANIALATEAEQRYRTTSSQLTVLWNNVKDVAITIGEALLPVVRSAIETLRDWLPMIQGAATWFSKLSPGVKGAIVVVAGLVAAVGPALVAFGALAASVSAILPWFAAGTVGAGLLTTALTLITGPIGIAAAAVAGLALVWATWGDDIKSVVSETFDAVKSWLVDKWEGSIFQSFARMLEAMGRLFGALASIAIEKVTALYTGVKTWVLDKLQPVFDAVKPLLDAVGTAFTRAKDAVIGTVTALYNGVKTWLLDKFTAIVDGVKQRIDAVTGFFNNMYDAVVGNSYVPDMLDRIRDEFGRLPTVMVAPAEDATARVEEQFEQTGTSVVGSIDQAIAKIGDRLSKFANSHLPKFGGEMTGVMGGIMGGLNDLMSGGMNQLISMGLSMAIEGAKKIGQAIGNLFKSEESKHVNSPRDQFFGQHGGHDGVANKLNAATMDHNKTDALMRAINAADTKAKFDAAQDAIAALIGGNKFAAGGIVSRPLIGQIGEAGPEAIMPLDRFERILASERAGASGVDLGGVERRLDGLTRMFRHEMPLMVEMAARHGAQTAGRRA